LKAEDRFIDGIPVRVRKSAYTLVIVDEMTHPAKQNGLEIIEISEFTGFWR